MFTGLEKLVGAITRSRTYFGVACASFVAVVGLILFSDLEGEAKAPFLALLVPSLPAIVRSAITADRERDAGTESERRP